MQTLIVAVAVLFALAFLWLMRQRKEQNLSRWEERTVAVSKYIVALFTATFGSNALAVLICSPLLLYARLSHREAAENLISLLLDRSYFPLQIVIAFVVGVVMWKWVAEGKPTFVWVLPTIQFLISVAVMRSRGSVLGSSWHNLWTTFFDWGCDCSASLLHWEVMFPLYTSLAFALGAYLRGTVSSSSLPSHNQLNATNS